MLSIVTNTNILRKLDELYLHKNRLEKFDFLNKPNLKSLTLSYNQWDCAALNGIVLNVMDSQQEQCGTGSQSRGICCQSSGAQDSQNLHKIKDLIREATIHELQNKKSIDEHCRPQIQQQLAMNEMNNRQATISSLEASKEPLLQEMSQVQEDMNRVDNQIAASQRETLAKNDQIALLAKEVDRWRATYGIEKEGLVDARVVLRRIVTFLEARKGNSNDLLKRRQQEVHARKGEKENKQNLAISGSVDSDKLKQLLNDLKVKEQALKTQRNALAAQVNKNSASIRGSSN
ncbi:conserved hypothetical protein [Culex quinquefasciatus]|nr:conserved hypothetical protein [Culex quinquefasciatus]|eukprot:XP_001844867.1 conserved hypothetical protein [Culex quinquefasciatus]